MLHVVLAGSALLFLGGQSPNRCFSPQPLVIAVGFLIVGVSDRALRTQAAD